MEKNRSFCLFFLWKFSVKKQFYTKKNCWPKIFTSFALNIDPLYMYVMGEENFQSTFFWNENKQKVLPLIIYMYYKYPIMVWERFQLVSFFFGKFLVNNFFTKKINKKYPIFFKTKILNKKYWPKFSPFFTYNIDLQYKTGGENFRSTTFFGKKSPGYAYCSNNNS